MQALFRLVTGPLLSVLTPLGYGLPKITALRVKVLNKMQSIFGPHNPSNPLSKYIQFDPKLKIGMRGSTQTGVRNNPNKTGNWNPKDFDLDLFIVSDELAAMNNGKIVKLPQVRDSLADDFPELFSGLRQGDKGVSVKFYTQVQAQNKGGTIFYDGSK